MADSAIPGIQSFDLHLQLKFFIYLVPGKQSGNLRCLDWCGGGLIMQGGCGVFLPIAGLVLEKLSE